MAYAVLAEAGRHEHGMGHRAERSGHMGQRVARPTGARHAWVRAELERRRRVEGPGTEPVAVLPPERFGDEYAVEDPRFPDERHGSEARAIAGLLCGACCGWARSPTAAEFYDAMRATERTPRQRAIVSVLIVEGSNDTIALAYLQGAFTWRQLATAMHEHGDYSPELADYVNLHARHR